MDKREKGKGRDGRDGRKTECERQRKMKMNLSVWVINVPPWQC